MLLKNLILEIFGLVSVEMSTLKIVLTYLVSFYFVHDLYLKKNTGGRMIKKKNCEGTLIKT